MLGQDPVRDVDDLDLGRDRLDDAVAGADEIVLEPEVAQEGDEHAATLTDGFRDGSDKPLEIVRRCLSHHLHTGGLGGRGRLGTD
jgi:hypothetical protein